MKHRSFIDRLIVHKIYKYNFILIYTRNVLNEFPICIITFCNILKTQQLAKVWSDAAEWHRNEVMHTYTHTLRHTV